ncbi:hypothetical protein Agabi119p4_10431 [Agaricus bisporus var. burnettii]|uniref:Uncharacterized protein n=1 Tax=Agaricus bisporus var. burnettii TaxID=192524 RepID=A0A8H7EWL6_AGABI|nr:hypothetical protein Agabi119p4_10431 [Agaricus bisporus var. burnettii]
MRDRKQSQKKSRKLSRVWIALDEDPDLLANGISPNSDFQQPRDPGLSTLQRNTTEEENPKTKISKPTSRQREIFQGK